ncbi:hypothetical protein [Cellulomonas sp. ES6]|uniref:hypothetical protein n=1 Tax=Cellulomonas sp. ES6 TaxID=3039384 RepID=UPI0024B7FFC9|nr:hypothetical protein [Cellulomonas sp. ES6]WHP18848.1 hypothetical protein P9841_06945 [Cellulomonas sp. ES6]
MNNPALPALITGVLGLAAVIVTQRLARRAQREMTPQQMIDSLVARLERAETRLEASEQRERLRDDYIHQLRDHISLGKAPPPPPWPEGLTT